MIPRTILILCEGTTEKLYFDLVIRYKRVSAVSVDVLGKQGQHENLIRKCVEKREEKAKDADLDEDEIEVWAVFDRDSSKVSYAGFEKFAAERNVRLAFSDPQFETYLLQHFELNKTKDKGSKLENKLTEKLNKKVKCSKYDLSWFETMIDRNPSELDQAIKNSNQLGNSTNPPFLTVQKLTKRLLDLADARGRIPKR